MSWQKLMLGRLATILKCEPAQVPFVFGAPKPKPLKIGIDKDLLERCPDADPVALGQWVKWWARNRFYVQRIVEGADRHDLDGRPVEKITAAHAKHARKLIGAPAPSSKPTSRPTRPVLALPASKVAKPVTAAPKPARTIVGKASSSSIKKEIQTNRSIRDAVSSTADSAFIEKLLRKARR